MENLKFRCSSLGKLMTNGRGKDSMGETAKQFIRETWVQEKYGRSPYVQTKPMMKGNKCEEDSLSLYTRVTGDLLIKHVGGMSNDWIKGTPDATNSECVVDIKSPYNIFTFMNAELTSLYEWQLRGYMWLTGKECATLAYCLVDMPEDMLDKELQWVDTEDYEKVKKLCVYSDIPEEERVKLFHIQRDKEKERQIIERVEQARIFAQSLTLNSIL